MAVIIADGLEFDGIAVSGVGSAISITNVGICLDIGTVTPASLKCNVVLITHGHIDHMSGLVLHANIRAMQGNKTTTYVVPPWLEPQVHSLFSIWAKLQEENSGPNVTVIALEAGKSVTLNRHKITAFATNHRIPSQGYLISEERKKLKKEFAYLPGDEIGRISRSGVEVIDIIEHKRIAYTGDTRASIFDTNSEAVNADVLITESTFLGDLTNEFVEERGHTHVRQIAERSHLFHNKAVILVHFSARYDNKMIAEEVAKLAKIFPVPLHFLPV